MTGSRRSSPERSRCIPSTRTRRPSTRGRPAPPRAARESADRPARRARSRCRWRSSRALPCQPRLRARLGHGRGAPRRVVEQRPRQHALPLAEAPVGLLQRDHVGVQLAQHRDDPLGIAASVEPHALVDVVAGEGELHRAGNAVSPGRCPDRRRCSGRSSAPAGRRCFRGGSETCRPIRRIGLGVVLEQCCPLLLERHQRHAPAAARLHALDRDIEDLARAGQQGEMRRELLPAAIPRHDRLAAAVDPQDQRGLLEIAEHQRDPPVGKKVRVGLVARAAEVEIGDALRREHA